MATLNGFVNRPDLPDPVRIGSEDVFYITAYAESVMRGVTGSKVEEGRNEHGVIRRLLCTRGCRTAQLQREHRIATSLRSAARRSQWERKNANVSPKLLRTRR